jgi:hypothetical protein
MQNFFHISISNSVYNFFKGWPKNCEYVNILNKIHKLLKTYLYSFSLINKKYTVIFDIDDTLVYTDSLNMIKDKKFPNSIIKGYMIFPEISQIASIARYCKQLNFYIIIITARPYSSEKSSIKNLELLNIKYDELYHNKNFPDMNFKIELKKKLAQKHDIILSIGDNWPDIQGLQDTLCIKLPNYKDINAYFTFDNKNFTLIE